MRGRQQEHSADAGVPDLVEVFVHDLQQNPLIQATARLRAPLVTVRSKARYALAVIGLHCHRLLTNLFARPKEYGSRSVLWRPASTWRRVALVPSRWLVQAARHPKPLMKSDVSKKFLYLTKRSEAYHEFTGSS
jgi:hypothetical protein